ncbi:MAG TPA: aminopeptidase P family protein [Acidimicrobiales bacterium]|nr:aminopeptidase P family protein [Acidimicrobiales bacterium]
MTFSRKGLAPMDVAGRVERLRESLDDAECDALLVTNLTNIRYLTGFSGSAGMFAVMDDELVFVTDGRYDQQSHEELAATGVDARIEICSGGGEAQRQALGTALGGVGRLGLESDSVTWAQQRSFSREWFPREQLVPTTGLVEELRQFKDEGEVARIGAACAMADAALAAVRHRLGEHPTESEVALELEWQMRRLGADGISFETIVASGPNGAKPHHQPEMRRIEDGDLVVIDFGALLDGYHSDMTRTIMVGEPSPTQAAMWDLVYEAQAAGVAKVQAGVDAKAVDDACRSIIRDAGWEEAFVHGTGHGVGLDIHEAPRVAATADATLAAGQVVTVEPGVYLAEHGGVRIEDTVVVTPGGCRTLTRATKDRDL